MKGTVLVLGNYRQTITVIRSLGRAGYRVIIGAEGKSSFTRFSSFVSATWEHPPIAQTERFYDALVEFAGEERDGSFQIFPVGEMELECLSKATPPSGITVISPETSMALRCLDKNWIYQQAVSIGIPLPQGLPYRDPESWKQAAAAFGYPILIKPKDSFRLIRGRKTWICAKPRDLEHFLKFPRQGRFGLILQKWVRGVRHNAHFAAYQGQVISYFEQEVLRTDIVDGTGYGVEGRSVAPNLQIRAYTEKLVAHLRYNGVGCVQFLVDSDREGSIVLLEINPRLDATCALPYFCGVDFPKLGIELCGTPEDAESLAATFRETPYPVGVRFHWLYGDFFGLLHAMRIGDAGPIRSVLWIIRLLWAATTCRRHLTWDWRDPLPTLYLYLIESPRSLAKALLNMKRRRAGTDATS